MNGEIATGDRHPHWLLYGVVFNKDAVQEGCKNVRFVPCIMMHLKPATAVTGTTGFSSSELDGTLVSALFTDPGSYPK